MVSPITMTDAIPITQQDGITPRNNALDIRRGMLTPILGGTGNDDFIIRPGVLPRKWSITGNYAPFTWLSLRPSSQTTASQAIDIQKGMAVSYIPGQGPYLLYQESTIQVTLDAAHPTNPRIDTVYIDMVDSTGNLSATEHGPYFKVANGTPAAIPAPPSGLPANSIELARITRPAGVNTVAHSQIQDVRRGTALYGGTRPLLPGDSLTDVGGYPGERRLRIAPTGSGLDHFVDEWGIDDKWHGTNTFQKTTTSHNGTGYVNETYGSAMSISIPDPGWPYRVTACGSLFFALGPSVGVDLVWKIGSASGTQFGGSGDGKVNTGGSTLDFYNTATTGISEVLNGAQTIHMTFYRAQGPAGNGYFAKPSARNFMGVTVTPA